MKSEIFRENMLKVIHSWREEQLTNLEFYKASTSLYKKFIESARANPIRIGDEPMIVLGLMCLEYYFESLPYNFFDKTYIPYLQKRLECDTRLSRDEEKDLRHSFIPDEVLKDRVARLKDVPFYKPFATLLESMDLKTTKIHEPKKFGYSVSSAASWSSLNINKHPSGEISWIDTLSFQDISISEPEFSGKGLCYAGLTSGGIELNIPFSFDLNLKTESVVFLLGDFIKNSSEEREKLTGDENVFFNVEIDSKSFFRRLSGNHYDTLAKNLASKL